MGQSQILSDAQIQELASDPKFTEGDPDWARLTPGERTKVAGVRAQGTFMGRAKSLGTGVAKGAGDTAFSLGNFVHSIPGIGNLTDKLATMVGPQGTNPEGAFSAEPDQLKSKNGWETAGKTAEQVAEFFPGAAPSKMASIERLVKFIPNATPANQMKILNKIAAVAGRTIGEGGNAMAVSALHGDPDPQYAGAAGAMGPLVGEGASAAVGALKTPLMQQIGPVLAAMLGMKAMGGITPGGLAGGMGAFGLAKQGAKRLLSSPATIRSAQNVARASATGGARVAAGGIDQVRVNKRRLQEAP